MKIVTIDEAQTQCPPSWPRSPPRRVSSSIIKGSPLPISAPPHAEPLVPHPVMQRIRIDYDRTER